MTKTMIKKSLRAYISKEKKNFPKPAKNCQKKRRGQTENRRKA